MKTKKMTNRQAQAMETKKKIYNSANELFQKYGFGKVSVDDIVEKAGVSKGSFYVYFNSKNSLITDVVADYVKELDLDYKSYLELFPADAKVSEILLSLVDEITDILVGKIGYDLIKIVYEAQLDRTVNPVLIVGYNRDLYKLIAGIIDKGIHQGELKKGLNVETATKYCVMTIRGATYEWCIRYPDYNFKKEVSEYFKILLAGMKNND